MIFSILRNQMVFILGFLCLQACAENDKFNFISVADSSFHVVGRHIIEKDGGIKYTLPGVSVYCGFSGTSLTLDIQDFSAEASNHNYLAVIIDQGAPIVLELNSSQNLYEITSILADTLHNLQIVKRTESFVGSVAFKGIRIDKDAKVTAHTSLPTHKIMFIGNSITCGYGNDTIISINPSTGFTSKNENNYTTYGQVAARALDAEYLAFAYSGRGLWKNFGGSTTGAIPTIFNRVFPDDPTHLWNHQKYVPDWLVVNLGTNDFYSEIGGNGTIDSIAFVTKYIDFVKTLKINFPKSQIILSVGSMMSDYYPEGAMHWTRIQAYVNSVVAKEKENGNNQIHFLAFDPQSPPYGEDWHPTNATHKEMGERLQAFIQDNCPVE